MVWLIAGAEAKTNPIASIIRIAYRSSSGIMVRDGAHGSHHIETVREIGEGLNVAAPHQRLIGRRGAAAQHLSLQSREQQKRQPGEQRDNEDPLQQELQTVSSKMRPTQKLEERPPQDERKLLGFKKIRFVHIPFEIHGFGTYLFPSWTNLCSRRRGMQPQAERSNDLENGGELRIAFRRQRLV